jgi:hypothetical protein
MSDDGKVHLMLSPATKSVPKAKVAPRSDDGLKSPAQPGQPNNLWRQLATHPLAAGVQASLPISPPDHPSEREADRIANQVLRMPTPQVRRKCAACAAGSGPCPQCEEEVKVQRQENGVAEAAAAPAGFAGQLGAGRALESQVRAFFEPRFAQDFSDVRIHADARAAESARAVNAAAYTVGRNVVFAAGQYRPNVVEGRRLLAHELAHVLQQSAAPADRATAGLSAPTAASAGLAVQRQPVSGNKEEEKRLEQASARGRQRAAGSSTEAMLSGAEIVYRLLRLRFPAFADSVTGVGLGEALFSVKIEPHRPGGRLDRDEGFSITVDRRFLGKPLHLQEQWLMMALQQLPALSGPGPGNYQNALRQSLTPLMQGEFGSTTGERGGEQDPQDAYDASTWQEVNKKTIRTMIEPSRAMRRLVDTIGRPVPKAGGGMTRWRMDCFDAVVFAQVYARWKTMSRFNFNQHYFPLELGFSSKPSRTEWERPTIAMSVGGPRFIPGRDEEAVPVQTPHGLEFRAPQTDVPESWPQLLSQAPVGSQVIWTNFDAQKRCDQAKQAGTDLPFCESWQAENAIKVGDDEYLAYPFGIINEERIKKELANATLKDLPPQERMPEAAYIKKFISVSLLRRPM